MGAAGRIERLIRTPEGSASLVGGLPWQVGAVPSTVPAKCRGNTQCPSTTTRWRPASPAEREKALMQALPQQIAHAKANAPFFATWLKDVDPAVGHLARGARQVAGAAQVDAGRGAEEEPADGRADRRADEQGAPRLHVARPDLRDRHRRARLFPRRARHACRRLPAGRRRLQHLLLSPDARRHHDGIGAAGAGLRRRAGRRRQHRAAARRHRRDQARPAMSARRRS